MTIGPIQFLEPAWLLIFPIGAVLCVLIARRSLSGLSGSTRWVALAFRLIVIAMLAGIMAEPQLREESENVATIALIDASRSVPLGVQREVLTYLEEAVGESKEPDDYMGYITVAKDAYVQALPSQLTRGAESQHIGAPDGTDLASGVRLALAIARPDAANRILLISDGNETAGSLLQAAEAAKAAGVPIDVLPLEYSRDAEVFVDRLVAPATARMGETLGLRVVLTATQPTSGRLTVIHNDETIDLTPGEPGVGVPIDLVQGTNVIPIPVTVPRAGPQEFEAIFEPYTDGGTPVGDAIAENNRAASVTFVSGEGKVLVIASSTEEADPFVSALRRARISTEVRPPESAPESLTRWNEFDAVVLLNQSYWGFTDGQIEDLRAYVHDSGGGLIMVGGPESFGAGGWIGSAIEDALPVRLDPPQKRQMPRGALAIIVHSVEMNRGVYYGKETCRAAARNLSRLDYIGINEFSGMGYDWALPMQIKGDGATVERAINNLSFGDMPDFEPSFKLTLTGLKNVDAGQKHAIVISDGDPSGPSGSVLRDFKAAGITVTAIAVGTHSGADGNRMRRIATATGGRFYNVNPNQFSTLPNIFIKEAQTIRRSLIWEGQPFTPRMTSGASDPMRGINAIPPISGYVVMADREGLSQVTLRGKEDDPVLAHWQYGLGRSVVFASDASTRWAQPWVDWGQYQQFWEQHVRWAMRPSGNANVRVTTEQRGDETLMVVEAFKANGDRLEFAEFRGRASGPEGEGEDVELRQVGTGRWEGVIATEDAGSYLVNLRYRAPGEEGGQVYEGNVQVAVERPFADEFRDLEDNAALLVQVAEATGGNVLTGDTRTDELWSRTNVTMPVATTPIWLAMVAIAMAMFLADVAVRRVRIDIPGMGRAVRRSLSTSKDKAGAQMDALQQAREKARQAMQTRPTGDRSQPDAPVPLSDTRSKQVAKRKFEVDEQELKKRKGGPSVLSGQEEQPGDGMPRKKPKADAPSDPEEQGMSRLLKAKKRARDEMEEDQ